MDGTRNKEETKEKEGKKQKSQKKNLTLTGLLMEGLRPFAGALFAIISGLRTNRAFSVCNTPGPETRKESRQLSGA
jgi:hypothetical protein